MGMYKRQTAAHYSQRKEQAGVIIEHRPAQQVQAGEKYAPAEQRSPLGNQHISYHVYPAHVFTHQVCGRLIKLGEYAGKVVGVCPQPVHEVGEAETAAYEKQHERQHSLVRPLEPVLKEQVYPGYYREKCRYHGKYVAEPQRRAKGVEGRGYAVAQEGVAHGLPCHYGVFRREEALPGYGGDYAQMHTHVAVGTLAGAEAAVRHVRQSMR